MKKFFIITSFLFLVFCAEKTYACSCIAPDPNKSLEELVTESYQKSSAVFTAKVLAVTDNRATYSKKVKLRLIKSWKGKLAKTFTITTASNSAACGFDFEIGKKYIIYAYRDSNKKLSTNICTRTAEIILNNDAGILDKLKKKT